MNEYFATIGHNLSRSIPTKADDHVNSLNTLTMTPNTISLETVTENGICNMILSLDCCKSPGIDGITPVDLKNGANSVTPILTEIINLSIFTVVYPDELKVARVIPYQVTSQCNDLNTPLSSNQKQLLRFVNFPQF